MKKTILNAIAVLLLITAILPAPLQLYAYNDSEATTEAVILGSDQKKALLSALYEADIATVREALMLRLISCRELTEYYLERIEEYNEEFNCFITMCDDALAEADKRDEAIRNGAASGSLFGIPVVVKDNINVEGYYTTNGKLKKKSKIAASNAAIVENMLNEGAVIIAKSNMSYEAQEARITLSKEAGETKNAYNTSLASGGSSGGSAVAVSLNFAMAGLGTDTNSSLRYPAALNGCVSMRPTFNLLPTDGIIKLNYARDVAGSITRSVKDQAIMLDALLGDGNYTESLDASVLSGMRIGVLKELSGAVSGSSLRTDKNIDDEVIAAFENAVKELEALGAEVVVVSMPQVFSLSNACNETYSNYKAAKNNFYKKFEQLLLENNISAVIYPTYLHSPQYTGVTDSGSLMIYSQKYINNSSIIAPPLGVPDISVPIGVHSRGAGIGMEIVSLKNEEQLLLNIAYSYTEVYDHRVTPNGAADIYKDYNSGALTELIEEYKQYLEDKNSQTTEEESDTSSPEEPSYTDSETTAKEDTVYTEPATTPDEETNGGKYNDSVQADTAGGSDVKREAYIYTVIGIIFAVAATGAVAFMVITKKKKHM